MQHRFLVVMPFVLAALFAPADASAAKFAAGLNSYKVTARPGEVLTHAYQLTLDKAEKPTRFKFKIEDFWRSEDGLQSYYATPGTLKKSCGNWVDLNPVEAVAEPGVTLSARLTINVPADVAPGGYWCVLTVDEMPDPLAASEGVGAKFVASVSTGIFINVEPVERAVEFLDVQVGALEARLKLRNDGNAPLAVEGRFEFLSAEQFGLVAVVPIPRSTLLPEPIATGTVRAPLPPSAKLPPGRYMVRAIIDIGLDHYLGVEREIEVSRDVASVK